MTETTITASTATYYRVAGYDPTYLTARARCDEVSATYKISNSWFNPNYICQRLTLKFDTSSIPDTDVVSDVKLRMVCTTDGSVVDFDVLIAEADWSSSDPLSDANRDTVYDLILSTATHYTWRNTSGMSVNTQYTGPSMTAGYVSKTGATYYGLYTSLDHDASTPSDDNLINLASPAHGTSSYRPALIITHAAAGRTTKNTDPRPLGLSAGISRKVNIP